MDVGPWIPAVTAFLTLANTVVLFVVNRRTGKTHREVNGMKLQLLQEAENRGRRLEQHLSGHQLVGE